MTGDGAACKPLVVVVVGVFFILTSSLLRRSPLTKKVLDCPFKVNSIRHVDFRVEHQSGFGRGGDGVVELYT